MPAPAQLRLKLRPRFGHGGARRGAGRPSRQGLRAHAERPEFAARHPLHLTLRLQAGLPVLRGKPALHAVRRALRLARAQGLRVVYYAILTNHVHLMVESTGKDDLARQMQSLGIALAKNLNRAWARRGQVLKERYHRVVITSALQAKNALAYVLTNEMKHRARKSGPGTRPRSEFPGLRIDAYSSAATFTEWRALLGRRPPIEDVDLDILPDLEPTVDPPRTWLLARGWRSSRAIEMPAGNISSTDRR